MEYMRVRWLHDFSDEPVWIVSELDEERWETRKVEFFADGRKGYANFDVECGGTFLGLVPWPPLEEIGAEPHFVPEAITAAAFEAIWADREKAGKDGLGELNDGRL